MSVHRCQISDLDIPFRQVAGIEQFLPSVGIPVSFRLIEERKLPFLPQLLQAAHELSPEEPGHCLYREEERTGKAAPELRLVFVILVLLILFAGAAANHWLLIRSERTNLELNSSSIVGSIEIVDQRFENLNLYLLQLTNSSTPQRLAIYAKTEQYPLIVSLSQQVYQNLNMVKNSFSEIKSLNLLLLESEHLLGDNYQYVRFERLPDGMIDSLMAEVERGNYISSDSKTCHLLYPMAQLLDDENQSGWLEASIYLEPLFTAIMANLSSDSLCAFEEDGVILNDEWPVELKDQDSGSWKHANGWYACAFEIPCISRQMNRHYRLAVCQPEAQFMGDLAHTYLIWTTVQTVTFLLSVIIFIVLIYKMVRKPMDRLMGILDVSPEAERALLLEDRRGDFQILYDRYTQMKSESSQKDEQIRAAMEAARQSEIKRLQAQISPHFLYNCFYQVYNLCKLEDSESAGDLSMLLAQYYEYIYKGLSNDKPLPLREEVEQAKRYLQIQQYRFVDRALAGAARRNGRHTGSEADAAARA